MDTFRFATAGGDVRIWNASTLELLHHFYVPNSPKARCLSWSSDEQQLLAVPKSGDFVFLTLFSEMEPMHASIKLTQTCTCAAYSHTTPRFLGIGCSSGDVLMWDLKSGKPRGTFHPHKAAVTCICFNVADSVLASGGADGAIMLNNAIVMTSSTNVASLPGQVVQQLVCSPFRKYLLASASNAGRIDVWDTLSCKRNHAFSGLHHDSTGVTFSHVNDSFMLSVGTEGNIGMYDVGSRKMQRSVKAPEGLHSVCFLHDGIHFVVGGASGKLYVYDLRRSMEPIVETLLAHVGPVTSACMEPLAKSQAGPLGPQSVASSFVLKPVETRAPMTLTSVIPDKGCNAVSPLTTLKRESGSLGKPGTLLADCENALDVFSPLNAVHPCNADGSSCSRSPRHVTPEEGSNAGRSLRTLRRESEPCGRSSILSVDYSKEYGAFSPLNAVHTVHSCNADESCYGRGSHVESLPALQPVVSSPAAESSSGHAFGDHEEVGVSPINPNGTGRSESCAEHPEPSGAPPFGPNGETAEGGSTMGNDPPEDEADGTERATSPGCSRDSETCGDARFSTAEDEAARVERAAQRLRLLHGVADDDTMLAMGSTVQVLRRVVRQEISDMAETFRAELHSLFASLWVDHRKLSEEIGKLKEF